MLLLRHDRRRLLHVDVTKHPTSGWIIQQLREAFPFEASHKYLIFDRDQKFGFEVIAAVKATRWVGSCRRLLLGGQNRSLFIANNLTIAYRIEAL